MKFKESLVVFPLVVQREERCSVISSECAEAKNIVATCSSSICDHANSTSAHRGKNAIHLD